MLAHNAAEGSFNFSDYVARVFIYLSRFFKYEGRLKS